MLIAGGGSLVGGVTYGYQSNLLEVSRESLVLPNLAQKLRIVAVSDVHAPLFYPADLVNMINAESPDIFILAGDIIDKRGNEDLVRMFREVKARYAKVATLGNWEYNGGTDFAKLRREYEDAGIALLVNAKLEASGLMIIGMDDSLCGSLDYRILKSVPDRSDSILVISHCPESFDSMTFLSHSPVVVLSGHTHGGQIAPFGVTLVTPPGSGPYVQGWYRRGKHSMYVMRGVGTSGVPLRIGARPELLVLDVEGTKV